MEYSFHVYNKLAADGVAMSMQKLLLARQTLQRMGAGLRSHTISRTHSHTISCPMKTMPPALKQSNPLPSSLQNTPPTQSLPFAPIKGRPPKKENPPVVVCIGSDLAIGDSLGPITGSMLKFKTQGIQVFIYGTLATPITAKEIAALRVFLKESHPNSPVIAIDAAVGAEGDVGLIKLHDRPL